MLIKKNFFFKRRLKALKTFLLSSSLRRDVLKLGIKHLYTEALLQKKSILCIGLEDLIQEKKPCKICSFTRVDGNLSYYELIVLSSLIQELKPKTLLEIGTFNGLGSLHMAMNAPQDAKVHTLDLLKVASDTHLESEDLKYIETPEKNKKIYSNFPQKEQIKEHYGDSLYYPFETFGKPDFIFIDGSHSYPMVKNDTEKSLKILSKGGAILWHDYTPDCPGVFTYLNELNNHCPIIHIKETSLACFF